MVAALRTTRRIIGSALALLLLSSWLSVAVAACLEHGQHDHAGMSHGAVAASSMSHDCPHCVGSAGMADGMNCADDMTDCDLPPAVLSTSSSDLKFAAIATHAAEPAAPRLQPCFTPPASTDPPTDSGRDRLILLCSFQE